MHLKEIRIVPNLFFISKIYSYPYRINRGMD